MSDDHYRIYLEKSSMKLDFAGPNITLNLKPNTEPVIHLQTLIPFGQT